MEMKDGAMTLKDDSRSIKICPSPVLYDIVVPVGSVCIAHAHSHAYAE
jgi:hypothetical protein